jgi:prolyl-tRNA synthetase
MNAIEGQEISLPVVMPREMWEECGRYSSIDASMARFQDRWGKDLVLGMTHEEAVGTLARSEAGSYRQYPFMLYQIQTKFRDEPRPRGGLVRVREFTMKDAYSFHRTQECLQTYYDRCFTAYEHIFANVGLKNTVAVQSDTGMMGGNLAHEFMLINAHGEDSLVICAECGYAANNEVAVCHRERIHRVHRSLEEIETPGITSVTDLCTFLEIATTDSAKAMFYRYLSNEGHGLCLVLLRGDLEVNEVKLAKKLHASSLELASDSEFRGIGAEPGYASTLGIKPQAGLTVVVDESIAECEDLIAGANKNGFHVRGFCPSRDISIPYVTADITKIAIGDLCASCQKGLTLTRGIEIGNIFQLGDRYTGSMGMSYLDESGKAQTPIMGCYGIGVGRLMAAIIEDNHDGRGPIWPATVAPFHVQICALEYKVEPIRRAAEDLYKSLQGLGLDVLIDDSDAKAGVQFANADLIGCPMRIVVSARGQAKGTMEYRSRDGAMAGEIAIDGAANHIARLMTR